MVGVHATPPEVRFAEDIRLIIWDLDETFWDGTLTEGGIRYRQDHHDLVITLAHRGIMSAICSKNDAAEIEALLRGKDLWRFFIFPSIDWTPKGPRLQWMIAEIGLRPQSVLFIDDNALNRAQAAQMVPGLNVAGPEVIGALAHAPELAGKPDEALTRLAQYKVKERKAQDAVASGGDCFDFLRASNVQVYVEHDVEAHLDRAIELINRTNQLNFTKNRLPEDPAAARAALTAQLARNTTDAGLIQVRDAYGDYGFAGFYLTERVHNVRQMRHFCFSCRTLNMYVEHWAYAFLARPEMRVEGAVLTDPAGDDIVVDWITPVGNPLGAAPAQPVARQFDRIIARGGCDLASLMHYFALTAAEIVEEFNHPKNGQMLRRDHSAFLMPALERPLAPEERAVAEELGYEAADFETAFSTAGAPNDLIFLSFWADADIPLYRHKGTGTTLPYWLIGAQNQDLIGRAELRAAVAQTDLQRARLACLAEEFEHIGLLSTAEMTRCYRLVLDHLGPMAPVILMLANTRGPWFFVDPKCPEHPHHLRLNTALQAAAAGRANVMLLDPAKHIKGADDLADLNHFKRPVYHAMAKEVMAWLKGRQKPAERSDVAA